MVAQLGAAALLSLAKSAARQAGVPLAKLTKKMIQNMKIPVRWKKLLQGPMTAGEKQISSAVKSSVTMAAGEGQAYAAGLLTPAIVTSILSASKDTGEKKAQPNVRSGIKTGTKKKPKVTKPMGFASTAKDKQIKSSSKKAVKKVLSSQPKNKVVKPKPRPKKPMPKVKPKRRPGS